MGERCYMKSHHAYKNYGGRGISVDPRWRGKDGFACFVADMGERPEGRTLDRIDPDGNYTKKNCRWATHQEQQSNRRNNSARRVRQLLESLDINLNDEHLIDTPLRVAKSLREDLLVGYRRDASSILRTTFSCDNDQMVVLKEIEFYSVCAHHVLPFVGKMHIGYIPNGRVVGLSKLARLAECFSRRLQQQENLSTQIVDALDKHLKPRGCAVVIEAKHYCMCARGVAKQNSVMVTSAIRGVFDKPEVRQEFMELIK
jgi:GTP cyclohydrolase I